VLSSLAEAARDELQMRERIAAGRQSTRRSVMIVVGVTLVFVLGLRWFNPGYVAPYATFTGQFVLLIVILLFAAGFFWLRRLAAFDLPGRFLVGGTVDT
jgi:Flp pilus assembly protein TadB